MRPRLRRGSQLASSARVAALAALLIAILYVAIAAVFDVVDAHHLTAQVDSRLTERLHDAASHGLVNLKPLPGTDTGNEGRPDTTNGAEAAPGAGSDIDSAPVLLWRVGRDGRSVTLTDGAPALPAGAWSRNGQPVTATLGSSPFRLLATPVPGGGWLVAGQSLVDAQHVENVVRAVELIAGPILVVAMFLGALAVGLRASRPVEQARRRQLEFTADASHELRTPLSVIEAELGLALSASRDAARYRDALERIGGESKRLRRIVEDLLWLSRFDSEPPPPGDEPVDVGTLAQACTERFESVARSRDITLSVERHGGEHAWIKAPPEWIDRLVGVLVDNACRYAGPGGVVRVSVTTRGGRVVLSVDDSGPGIPPEERGRLFDRFHRSTTQGGGAGLGLAIADAVVRSTQGTWQIGDAPEGGAHLEVSWHRSAHPREAPPVSPRSPEAPPPGAAPPTQRPPAAPARSGAGGPGGSAAPGRAP